MNRLNVFNNPKLPLKYPENWIKTFRMFRRSFKYAYQRITRGYSDSDLWDFDTYLLELFTHGLSDFADRTIGYPGDDEFPTYESWTKFLHELALHFLKANECNDYFPHPAQDAWWNELYNCNKASDEKVAAMIKESNEIALHREEELNIGLNKLKHIFFHLWD